MQIFANPLVGSPSTAQQPADTTTQSSDTNPDSNSATITANDFLQLLVTEMQNQDPTADTDPNEYIDQLVQVNSLEQLISINQDLSGLSSSSGSTGSSGTGSGGTSDALGAVQAQSPSAPTVAAGNLSATDTGGRASRIAGALGTAAQTLAPGSAQSPISNAIRSLRDRAQQAHTNVSNPAH
ncbi:MAG TPA: flagellar hook capping FlgD N-terminal domain-containing protein [Acidobacteriaceae bacterium]|nr:flagellar hook capping FlgD N-terminal domain-containing protein [Acidobacteriaceae bacterium]